VTKNPVFQFLLWSLFLSRPVFAQEAIQIEIDSAPVEVEIPQPTEPSAQPEPSEPQQAEKTQPTEEEQQQPEEGGHKYGVAIGIGALVAGLLAALGGGGGSGGGSSTPQHP